MQSSGPAQDVPATIVRLPGIKPRLNLDPNHAGPIQEGTETDWEHFCDDLFTVNEDKARLNVNMQEIFTMIQKHLFSSTCMSA